MRPNQPLVKLSAPASLDGMLLRDTFDVPATKAGTDFMHWWEDASREKRAEVYKYANDNNIGVVDALVKVRGTCGS